jgi:argininosuccinate lyase
MAAAARTSKATRTTTVGTVREDVLAYTAGEDLRLDQELVEYDCIGTAAHVRMLGTLRLKPPILRPPEVRSVVKVLAELVQTARRGEFEIRPEDQDCHLAIERILTERLGEVGRKIHTGRSRNDQVATALRLHTRDHLLHAVLETVELARVWLGVARAHVDTPMVGRTHLQPAMPSSLGLWAAAWAEELLDDAAMLLDAADLADQCPLGAAASYGVPLPLRREYTADLLGFSRPTHTVLYAIHTRGKIEALAVHACAQTMLTLSRMASDLVLFATPEFGYVHLPESFCTGSSIMPQKRNPDVLELVRSRTARVIAAELSLMEILRAMPSGYHRDLQDTKAPYLEAMGITRASLQILAPLIRATSFDRERMLAAFRPEVFATDRALELVAQGVPFRDAYQRVRAELDQVQMDHPVRAIQRKRHLGAPGGLDLELLQRRADAANDAAMTDLKHWHRTVSCLLGIRYPPER